MKTGLFFGTFNPVHIGHTIIAGFMAEFTDLDEVWIIVSPRNPLKSDDSLLDERHRLKMVEIAFSNHNKIKASDIEFNLPRPSYTINTLRHIAEVHPENEFVIIMGSDNLQILKEWKDYEQILDTYEIYVYPRLSFDKGELKIHPKVKMIPAPVIEVSSTFIRKAIKEKRDVSFLLPANVNAYLHQNRFYQ